MPGRREQIRMTDAELAEFLDGQHVVSVASNGRDGWPHVVALWYVMQDGDPWIWTYAKSQKVTNIERDPRATLMVEDGQAYNELRGAMLRTRGEIVRDYDPVCGVGESIYRKYSPLSSGEVADAVLDMVRAQSRKRVAVRFRTVEIVSWDHRKL